VLLVSGIFECFLKFIEGIFADFQNGFLSDSTQKLVENTHKTIKRAYKPSKSRKKTHKKRASYTDLR
jgi:hypothetical protein